MTHSPPDAEPHAHRAHQKKPWYRILYIQVLIAVALGIIVGAVNPSFGKSLEPLGSAFVNLVKMIIAPIIFCTVVHGIASMGDGKRVGRLGVKTLIYFEVVSTLALAIGLIVINVWQPGVGFPSESVPVSAEAASKTAEATTNAKNQSTVSFLLAIIPTSFFGAFASGDILQVLFISLLTAFAVMFLGERGKPILRGIGQAEKVFFGIMHIIVKIAPLAAFGAMAYTVGNFGTDALRYLLALMLGFYATAAIFIFLVLGLIARLAGFSIFRFIAYLKEELLLVLGTSSSETALPGLLEKTRRLGCKESTVGFVVPTGYSFNLDGTNIYITMGAIFLAQATGISLDLGAQLRLLLVAMLTSKGAAGVTGSGFVALAATMSTIPKFDLTHLGIIYGIDRFMSECRALTNFIGNGVATVVISRSEGEVTAAALRKAMSKEVSVVDLPPGTA